MNAAKVDITLYHNPRCTKSRAALTLLRSRGVEPDIVEYLKTPPTAAELARIVGLLGIAPEALVRKGEDIFVIRVSCFVIRPKDHCEPRRTSHDARPTNHDARATTHDLRTTTYEPEAL